MMGDELRGALAQYLAEHNTMTLATCGAEGPAAAALFYVSDDQFRLYFLSELKALHAVNLAREPRVAVTIHEDYRDWRLIQGVQMRGEARALTSPIEQARALKLYLQKYPFLQELISSPRLAGELLTQKIGQSRFHLVEPHWMRWIDNEAGFGFRREWDLRAGQEMPREQ